MTENKPIMIDGVNVSICERHCSDNHNRPNRCYSDITESYRDCQPKENQCNFYITSIEQQLKRKTQECEELKKECNEYFELMAIRTEVLAKNKEIFNKIEQLKTSKEQAEQKLEKIIKIANGMHDMWINKTKYTDVYNLAEHLLKCELNRIINEFDEIDEVE